MAFNFNPNGDSDNSNKPEVDYVAMNQHVIDKTDAEQPEVYQGVISGIIDLGEQVMSDSVYELSGEDEVNKSLEELNDFFADKLASGEITKFDIGYNGKTKQQELMKYVPQKNRHCVDILVDFPDIIVDKGQFFGKSDPKPLRLSLGGQFYQKNKAKMLLQRPIPLKITKDDNIGWTMPVTSTLYKMALAGKVISKNEAFVPQDIDKLLGVNLQFTVQVYNKQKYGKKYYSESIKLAGGLGKKMTPVEDYPTFLIQFGDENDPEILKELRKVHINQIEESPQYENSKLKEQLENRGSNTSEGNQKEDKVDEVNTKPDLDDDLPF